jgi:hypothetical protein
MRFRVLWFGFFSSLLLSGCGFGSKDLSSTNAPAPLVQGKVFGGQQPITGSTVTVWEAGTGGYAGYSSSTATALATVMSGAGGLFAFPANSYTCTTGEQVYITAQGGYANPNYANPNILLAAGLGECSAAQSAQLNVNEVTTAVTAFALGRFFSPVGSGSDYFTSPSDTGGFALSNQYTIPTLVNLSTGSVNPNTAYNPASYGGAAITIEAAKIYSLANVLAACVNDGPAFGNCTKLFQDTTYTGTQPGTDVSFTNATPTNTLEAAVQMSIYPYNNVTALYDLSTPTAPFVGLAAAPNDWTIGISYTNPNYGLSIAGTATSGTSSNIDIDASGDIWFPTNMASSHGLAFFNPLYNIFQGPFANYNASEMPILNAPQYLAIDPSGYVWATDLSSGFVVKYSPSGGAEPVYVTGLGGGATSSGPLAIYADGTVYVSASSSSGSFLDTFSNEGAMEFIDVEPFTRNPTGMTIATGLAGETAAGIVAATSGSSTVCSDEFVSPPSNTDGVTPGDYVDSTTTSTSCISGGAATIVNGEDQLAVATTTGQICSDDNGACMSSPVALTLPEGIATDGDGYLWVANSGNGSVGTFYAQYDSGVSATVLSGITPQPYLHGTGNGGTMTTPYGVAIDRSGNVWVSNASCVTTSATPCVPTGFTLSELIGAAFPAETPLSVYSNGNQGFYPSIARRPGNAMAKKR